MARIDRDAVLTQVDALYRWWVGLWTHHDQRYGGTYADD
jgi:hypothetical protein